MSNDEYEMHSQATDRATGAGGRAPRGEPGVILTHSEARIALQQAERSVDKINDRLRSAEGARDALARQVGDQQKFVDQLLAERDCLTAHVRNLLAAQGGGDQA